MNETNAPQKVLIVDDTPQQIKLLVSALKGNWTISVATSGAEALAIAAGDSPPDLILLDILMPEMDGYQVCRRLKERKLTRDIPVIFLSALIDEEDETKGLGLGAVDYITKPFKLPIVKARITTHLELKRCHDLLKKILYEQTVELSKVEEEYSRLFCAAEQRGKREGPRPRMPAEDTPAGTTPRYNSVRQPADVAAATVNSSSDPRPAMTTDHTFTPQTLNRLIDVSCQAFAPNPAVGMAFGTALLWCLAREDHAGQRPPPRSRHHKGQPGGDPGRKQSGVAHRLLRHHPSGRDRGAHAAGFSRHRCPSHSPRHRSRAAFRFRAATGQGGGSPTVPSNR